jgi:hypothetical protein
MPDGKSPLSQQHMSARRSLYQPHSRSPPKDIRTGDAEEVERHLEGALPAGSVIASMTSSRAAAAEQLSGSAIRQPAFGGCSSWPGTIRRRRCSI